MVFIHDRRHLALMVVTQVPLCRQSSYIISLGLSSVGAIFTLRLPTELVILYLEKWAHVIGLNLLGELKLSIPVGFCLHIAI